MVYELDFSFVFKLPQISLASESCIVIYQLHIAVCHNEFISVSVFVCLFVFFFHIHVRFHFKTPREFYACDWTTTFSEQQNSQTITDSFWHLQCLFVVGQTPVSGHLVRPHIFSAYLWEPFSLAASSSNGHLFRARRVSAHESFHCSGILLTTGLVQPVLKNGKRSKLAFDWSL